MRKIILDVDTGSDDAVAIMTAVLNENIEVEAICTVWGNLEVDDTTENTLRLLDKLNADVPVYRGCPTAMVKYLSPQFDLDHYAPVYKDGRELRIHYKHLEGLEPTDRKAEDMDAVSFYVNYLRHAKEKVTLILVGPLTNLGEALSIDPTIVKNVEQIIIMGGGDAIANVTWCAEANIWHDPEAAHIIINSGADVLMVPLDATHSAALTLEDCKKLRELHTFAGDFAAKMTEQRIEFEHAKIGPKKNDSAIHDALAVCSAIDPSVLTDCPPVYCQISLAGASAGETIIDRRCIPEKANIHFAFKADKEKFLGMLLHSFRGGREG